jgi:hypothetical protein
MLLPLRLVKFPCPTNLGVVVMHAKKITLCEAFDRLIAAQDLQRRVLTELTECQWSRAYLPF